MKHLTSSPRRRRCGWHSVALATCTALFVTGAAHAMPPAGAQRLAGHIPPVVASAHVIGRTNPGRSIPLAFVFHLRDEAGLDTLLKSLNDPADPSYGHYLTTQQFADRFGPAQGNYDAVVTWARSRGLTITGMQPTRTLLIATAPASAVEAAFAVHLNDYRAADGHVFFAPDTDPAVPSRIAPLLSGIVGLNNAAVWHTHIRKLARQLTAHRGAATPHAVSVRALPHQIGTATNGALTPQDIETAYSLKIYPPATPNDTTGYGKGQVLGLFELDTYTATDISDYEQKYNLPHLTPTNKIVSPPTPTGGEDEVTLDIELQLALAPLAKQILVYEGANENTFVVQQYQKIADDNLAKSISTSWGATESGQDAATLTGENNAFKQMAAQGQTIFAASGDSGAYDNARNGDTTSLLVDDPASQPYMCGTGGTTLSVVHPGTDEHYLLETSWGDTTASPASGGGGGISQVWTIPDYQKGVVPANSKGSTTMRNVPDVAFNANPNTGYDIIFAGTDSLIFGGTSCAAPIWAGFTARINELRLADGLPLLGFANPPIYQLCKSAGLGHTYDYDTAFHDIEDGSTNLYYPAVEGYDDSTGWGSFVGNNLLRGLGAPGPNNVTATGGNQSAVVYFSSMPGAISYEIYRATGSGSVMFLKTTTSSPYSNTGLTNGTKYTYYVKAVYAAATSLPVGPVSVTPH